MKRKISYLVLFIILLGCASSKVNQNEVSFEDDNYYFVDTLTMNGFVVFYSNFSEFQDDYTEHEKHQTIPVFIEYGELFSKGKTLDLNDDKLDFSNTNNQGRWLVQDPLRVYNDIVSSNISNNDLFEQAVYDRLKTYSENEFSSLFKINDHSKLKFQSKQQGNYYPGCITYDVSIKFTRAFRGFGELPGYSKTCIPYVSAINFNTLNK